MFTDKVTVRIKKDKKFTQYIQIIRKYDESLSMVQIKKAMENDEVVFSFDPKNNPIIHDGKNNSVCFLEDFFTKTLRLLKKAGAAMIVKEGNNELLEYSKVSASQVNIDQMREKLYEANEGNAAYAIIDKLTKIAQKNESKRSEIIKLLMDYSMNTAMLHLRALTVIDVSNLVKENEMQYGAFFKAKIQSGDFTAAYYGIEGYSKVMQKEAYEYLVTTLLSRKLNMECEALIVSKLSQLSNQPFDQGSPWEYRNWKESDLRLTEIEAWAKEGYPDGDGYTEPRVHSCLQNPQTAAEKVYASLDSRLAKKREKNTNKAHPTNWLVEASADDLEKVRNSLRLSENYLDFLSKASPLNVEVKLKEYGSIDLYGAHELLDAQNGYSFNPVTNEKIDDWPENFIVIASCEADPFCIDCTRDNSPVFYAAHGMGEWNFDEAFSSLIEFLKALK